jgi:predicted lipoprotein with Yx(FWY)xxD motif
MIRREVRPGSVRPDWLRTFWVKFLPACKDRGRNEVNRTVNVLCLLVVAVLAFAGCGGGDDGPGEVTYGGNGGSETSASGSDGAGGEGPARVYRADTEEFQEILFDEGGYTLYRFSGDKGSEPSCYGACAEKWPPLITEGQPVAYAVLPSKLGQAERKDGTVQATYFGHPLYTYVGDKVTGEVTGHGVEAFGGTWYALHKNGKDLEH